MIKNIFLLGWVKLLMIALISITSKYAHIFITLTKLMLVFNLFKKSNSDKFCILS